MTTANLWTDQQTATASYPTGGFVVTTTLTSVKSMDVTVNTPGSLGQVHFICVPDSPGAGQVTVKVMRDTYKKLSLGSPTGLPSGVTAPSSSGQTVASESSHTMDLTHGHTISAASTTMANGSGLVTQVAVGGGNTSTGTHTVTIPSASFNTGAGSAHDHTWNNIYQHQHGVTNTATDVALVEVTNGTDLSSATLNFMAVDA